MYEFGQFWNYFVMISFSMYWKTYQLIRFIVRLKSWYKSTREQAMQIKRGLNIMILKFRSLSSYFLRHTVLQNKIVCPSDGCWLSEVWRSNAEIPDTPAFKGQYVLRELWVGLSCFYHLGSDPRSIFKSSSPSMWAVEARLKLKLDQIKFCLYCVLQK